MDNKEPGDELFDRLNVSPSLCFFLFFSTWTLLLNVETFVIFNV